MLMRGNGQAVALLQSTVAPDMIGVVVRIDNQVQVLRRHPRTPQ